MNEMRWLMNLLIFRKQQTQLSNGSLRNYTKPINAMARYCRAHNLRIQELLSDSTILMAWLSDNVNHAKLVAALLTFLDSQGTEIVGYSVVNRKTVEIVRKKAEAWIAQHKQHPPIPTRIYSEILATLVSDVEKFSLVADRLLPLLEDCLSDKFTGRSAKVQWKKLRANQCSSLPVQPDFDYLLQKHSLTQFWIENGYYNAIGGLSRCLLDLMLCTSLQIQAYTGMRANEVATLPFDCIDETRRAEDQSMHIVLTGRVRKRTGGKAIRAKWITSESGRRAVRLAQRLATVLHKFNNPDYAHTRNRSRPTLLFTPVGLWGGKKKQGALADLKGLRFLSLKSRLPYIGEDDLLELERIDPHRAWRSEPRFQIGQRWHFTPHQLRRSLALYAQRSGLVSLPSLKRQLHHITAEMSLYYARGSAFAADFIVNEKGKNHFGVEWQEAQPVSQYLGYAINVLLCEQSDLFGVHSHWIKHRVTNSDGIIQLDRAETLTRFKRGELAYKETLLGGCVKVGECSKNPLDIMQVECLKEHCKYLVGSKKKLERVIAAQSRLTDQLAKDSTSAEYRHEKAILATLQGTLNSLDT
jgi:integrase